MTKISAALLALFACLAAAAPARFSTTTRHDYAIGGGVLKLDVPDEWQGGLAVGATSDAPTVQFGNEEGARFQILPVPWCSRSGLVFLRDRQAIRRSESRARPGRI